jgi:hypothetical protein
MKASAFVKSIFEIGCLQKDSRGAQSTESLPTK